MVFPIRLKCPNDEAKFIKDKKPDANKEHLDAVLDYDEKLMDQAAKS